ncbi:MAG: 2-amino-4-hydroxy-6-hydroxymethyldihydropteridine diphosphokinase [Planctomycetaceae bacterium]
MATCHIALGGNVGDVIATMDRGLDLLDEAEGVSVIAASPVYYTEPVGPCSGDTFLNAAATLTCDLEPLSLLRLLKSVEASVGRESESRWGPRPLDLDLILFDDAIVREPPLKVPHPHMWYRRFVLDPLVDIAADVRHPLFDESIQSLRSRLLQRPLRIAVQGDDEDKRLAISALLTAKYPEVLIVDDESSTQDAGEIAMPLELRDFLTSDHSDIQQSRVVRISELPGTTEKAAVSVLTAALDQPVNHSRPLRRMP